jgi:nitrogen fixation protein NifQ
VKGVYPKLMASCGAGDPFDRHVLACILAKGAAETGHPLTEALGLPASSLAALVARFFPGCEWLLERLDADAGPGPAAIEEPDLRDLLLASAEAGDEVAPYLAAMTARRALKPNHLWEDLGLASRSDLSQFLLKHFHRLASKNTRDMKWKKFFYRALCEAEGLKICKSPICDECPDFDLCFGPEA